MAQAIEAQDYEFGIGNGDSPLTYTEVKEITSWNGPDGEASNIDVTHLKSLAKEYLMGLADNGSYTLEINYLPDDAGQILMRAARVSRLIQDFKVTLSDGTGITFQGFVKNAPSSGAVDEKVSGSYNILISGAVTEF